MPTSFCCEDKKKAANVGLFLKIIIQKIAQWKKNCKLMITVMKLQGMSDRNE